MQWTAAVDKKILVFLMQHADIKIPLQNLADHLGCTPKALTHHIAKLKAEVANADTENDGEKSPKKAVKRKRAPTKKEGKASKKPKVEDSEEVSADNEAE